MDLHFFFPNTFSIKRFFRIVLRYQKKDWNHFIWHSTYPPQWDYKDNHVFLGNNLQMNGLQYGQKQVLNKYGRFGLILVDLKCKRILKFNRTPTFICSTFVPKHNMHNSSWQPILFTINITGQQKPTPEIKTRPLDLFHHNSLQCVTWSLYQDVLEIYNLGKCSSHLYWSWWQTLIRPIELPD